MRPMNPAIANVAMLVLVAALVAMLGVGVAASARLAGRAPASATTQGGAVAFAVVFWLAVTAGLASSGALSDWTARPPRLPLVALAAFASALLVARTEGAKRLASTAPLHWAIGAQTFRVAVELVLLAFYLDGRAPIQVTFEGRNFDILAGLTAPVAAWLVARRGRGPGFVVAWNVLGLALLVNIIGTFLTSVPGALHAHWPGEPFTAAAAWPVVWVPAFLAPLAVFLHAVSLRQAIEALRRGQPVV